MTDAFFTLLPGIAVRAAVILLLGLLAARIVVRRSAAIRHAIYAAAIVGVLILPALTIALPAVHAPFVARAVSSSLEWLERPIRSLRRPPAVVATRASETAVVDEISFESAEAALPISRGGAMLTLLWFIGVLIIGVRTTVRATRASRLVRRARHVRDESIVAATSRIARGQGVRRAPRILESTEVSAPATTGILRSVVLLPAARSWSDEHLHTVLTHEIAHVARRDCLTQHLAQVACALYWFNPLAWIVERRMSLERERACDDIAMGHGSSAEGYATLLLDVARRTCERALPKAAVLAMARPSELETRLMAILDPARDRGLVTRRARRTLSAAAVVTVAGAGVVHLEAAPLPDVSAYKGALTIQQGRGEPDMRGDSVAAPESERIARASVQLARRRGQVALGGPDSALAHVLLMSLERVPRGPEDLVRERAAWALTQVRGDRLIEPLIDALDDKDWRVRAYAAWALAPTRDPRAVPALVRQMSHPVWRLRAMASHALAETSDARARPVMTAAASDEAWQVRVNAVRYLARLNDADARARVREALRDRHIAVRRAAERAGEP